MVRFGWHRAVIRQRLDRGALRSHDAPPGRRPAAVAPLWEPLEIRLLLSGAAADTPADPSAWAHPGVIVRDVAASASLLPASAMSPAQMHTAYGFDRVMFGSIVGDGTGQTIAIVDAYDYPAAAADLAAFDTAMGLPSCALTRVAQDGTTNYPSTDPAGAGASSGTWEEEEALDIEWAHAMAPGANILLVEARDPSDANLIQAAVNWARNQPGVVAVSMSFSGGEFGGGRGETTFDTYFTTPTGHAGVTFLAATGDTGQPGGYPAYSPNVVAVGGTGFNADGTETGWSGSGGGLSVYESQPSYQSGVVTQSSTRRAIPDVSMDADPNSGAMIYDSYDYPSTPWLQIGGTSLATPMWAGLVAIVAQARTLASLPVLTGTQMLTAIYQAPTGDFNDILTGNNGFAAGGGYDLVTGRGTPIAGKLVYDLAGVASISGKVFQDNNGDALVETGEAALSGVMVYLDANNDGAIEQGTTLNASASAGLPLAIPDNNSSGATSTLTVAGPVGAIASVTVTLTISHTHDSDLTAYLIAPDGTTVQLFSGVGGFSGQNFTGTTFSDGASVSIKSGSAPFSGTYRPTGTLASLAGKNAAGVWSLKVVDGRYNNTGSLQSWSLGITTAAEASTLTDAHGNYSFVVPAGSYPVRQIIPTGDVQTGPAPGSSPSGANLVASAGNFTGLNFGDFSTVFANASDSDSYYVVLDPSGKLDISAAAMPLTPPTWQIASSLVPSLTFNLLGAANTLFVDFTNGSPIPTGDISLTGAPGAAGALQVIGQSPSQAMVLSDTQIGLVGAGGIVYQNVATIGLADCTVTTGPLGGAGAVHVGAGATLEGSGTISRTITLTGGALVGAMALQGALTSVGGSISPAAGAGVAGTLSVAGNLTLDAATTLDYQLSTPGQAGGGANDLVSVAGNVYLDGTLSVTALAGFGPGTYTLLTCTGTLSGPGLTIGSDMPANLNYSLSSDAGAVTLSVSSYPPGDVNHDTVVNSLDIDAIYRHFGSVALNPLLGQYDLDGDGTVDQADVTYELTQILHTNYGDANLDHKVGFADFQKLLDHWQTTGAGWAGGDFNGDGTVDFLDFQYLLDYWNPGGYATSAPSGSSGAGNDTVIAGADTIATASSSAASTTGQTVTTSAATATSATAGSGTSPSQALSPSDAAVSVLALATPTTASTATATIVTPSGTAAATASGSAFDLLRKRHLARHADLHALLQDSTDKPGFQDLRALGTILSGAELPREF